MQQATRLFFANLGLFARGALWAAASGLLPAVIIIWDTLTNYTDPIDWQQVARVALASAGAGVVGFYRKHQALLTPPPGFLPEEPKQ